MVRLLWFIHMSPKLSSLISLWQRGRGTPSPHTPRKAEWRHLRWWLWIMEWCGHTRRNVSRPRSWNRQGRASLLETLEHSLNSNPMSTSWFQPRDSDSKFLAPRTGREYISTVLSHPFWDHLLQQPEETNILITLSVLLQREHPSGGSWW